MPRYNQEIKENVRALRVLGFSLGQIREQTHVPRTTIRDWISDIILSSKQQEALRNKVLKGLQEGRIRSQAKHKEERVKKEQELLYLGIEDIGTMSKRDLFIAGVALYWAEGFKNKHEHRLGFCNSDPKMILFYIKWLEKTLKIKRKDIIARLTINISYKKQVDSIQQYWSKLTKIPLSQFTKPFYQNTNWKKRYSNSDEYHGVLRIHVKDSVDDLLKMKGWIEGLKTSIIE